MNSLSHFLLAGLSLALLSACSRREPAAVPVTEATLAVSTVVVSAERLPLTLDVPATVHPAERAVISARLAGTITSFHWGLGQSVKAGEVLLRLSAPEAEARVRQAQAQAAEASRTADRERTLVAKGVSAPESARDADDRRHFADAALAEAEALLAFATVRAPFDGVVTVKSAQPGDLATPGLPLLAFESTQRLRAEGSLPEKFSSSLRIGDSLGVIVDEASAPLTCQIEELSTAADAVSRSLWVKVALPTSTARSGQFVRLQVPAGEADALMVPSSAVSRFGQMERLFVVENLRAALRIVKTGRAHGERIEILSGLHSGERLVLAPPVALRDGSPVTVQP